jgi:DNA-binding protein Fis
MKITKTILKQIIKEELLKEQQVSDESIKNMLFDKMMRRKEIDTRSLIDSVSEFFGDKVEDSEVEAVLQSKEFNKYYNENDNYHALPIITGEILDHIKNNPGKSLKVPKEVDGEQFSGIINMLLNQGKIEKREDGYAIKQDLKESIKQIVKEQLLKEFDYDDELNNPEPELPPPYDEIDKKIDEVYKIIEAINEPLKELATQVKDAGLPETVSVRDHVLEAIFTLLKNLNGQHKKQLKEALVGQVRQDYLDTL